MTPDDPRHGTNAGAMQHWRDGEPVCEPCSKASAIMCKQHRLARHRGNPATVTLGDEAWAIIHFTPRKQLSKATGIRVDKLVRYDQDGPTQRVQRTSRDRILAAATLRYWTPVGIQRRLQALTAMGWSMQEIARRTGVDLDGLKRLRRRENPKFVREYVATAVLAVYQELSETRAPSSRSSSRSITEARRAGYAPPAAWDAIDDLEEKPKGVGGGDRMADLVDHAVVARLLAGDQIQSTRAEKEAAMTQWLASGRPERLLCDIHGWKAGRYVPRNNEGDAA